MRAVQLRGAPVDDDFVSFMSTCVQCRGCEPACPSGVPYGHLIEGTREMLAETGRITPWWQKIGFSMLSRHRLLLAASSAKTIHRWAQIHFAGLRQHLVPHNLVDSKLDVQPLAELLRSLACPQTACAVPEARSSGVAEL